jgi:hypothetical protein
MTMRTAHRPPTRARPGQGEGPVSVASVIAPRY